MDIFAIIFKITYMKYRLIKPLSFAEVGSIWVKADSSFYKDIERRDGLNWIPKEIVEQTDFFEPIEEEGYVLVKEDINLASTAGVDHRIPLVEGRVYQYKGNVLISHGEFPYHCGIIQSEDWKSLQKVKLVHTD